MDASWDYPRPALPNDMHMAELLSVRNRSAKSLSWLIASLPIRIYNGKYCFRPQWPKGEPRVAEAVSRVSGAEGLEGNIHASRVWKGNGEPHKAILVFPPAFPFHKPLKLNGQFAVRSSLSLEGPLFRGRPSSAGHQAMPKSEERKAKGESTLACL